MNYPLKVNWSWSTHTLTGNEGVEKIISTNKLPQGVHWLILEGIRGTLFMGSRKIPLRPSGKGQITIKGIPGVTCELVKGKTSNGEAIEFVMAREPVPFEPKAVLSLPFPVRRESISDDLRAYRGMCGRKPLPERWAKYLGWASSPSKVPPTVFHAAEDFHWMVNEKIHSRQLEFYDRMVKHGVVMDHTKVSDCPFFE